MFALSCVYIDTFPAIHVCVCSKKSTIVCYTGEFIVHVPNSSFHSVVEFLDEEKGFPDAFHRVDLEIRF